MAKKIWMGAIFLNDEGGHTITVKSLLHYKKRLQTLGNSPELKDAAAMFASVLNQQAQKTIPKIDTTIHKIQSNLNNIQDTLKLDEDASFLEKALACYKADIHKAQDTGHEYFVRLVGNMEKATKELETINIAIKKIKEYSQ